MGSSDEENSAENNYFKCGSCTFRHDEEERFVSHIHEDHKQEYGFWCGFCGKHFSVAPPLVKHMKESCTKVSLFNLKCGFEDCSFTTTEPMTFINHLKIVHKGLHLLPCLNCQRVFTIPACLIEHMQKECTKGFKIEGKGKGGGDSPDSSNAKKVKPAPASVKRKALAKLAKEKPESASEEEQEDDGDGLDDEEEAEEITPLPNRGNKARPKKNVKQDSEDDTSDSDGELMEILPDRRGRLQRTAKNQQTPERTSARKKSAPKHYDESDEVDDLDEDDVEDEDIENGSDSDTQQKKRGRSAAKVAGRPKAKRTRK